MKNESKYGTLYGVGVGHDDETIETDAGAIADHPIDYLSLMIARRGSRHE